MHASNQTLSRYIHLASEINNFCENELANTSSTHTRMKVKSLKEISKSIRNEEVNIEKGMDLLLKKIDEI